MAKSTLTDMLQRKDEGQSPTLPDLALIQDAGGDVDPDIVLWLVDEIDFLTSERATAQRAATQLTDSIRAALTDFLEAVDVTNDA